MTKEKMRKPPTPEKIKSTGLWTFRIIGVAFGLVLGAGVALLIAVRLPDAVPLAVAAGLNVAFFWGLFWYDSCEKDNARLMEKYYPSPRAVLRGGTEAEETATGEGHASA